MQWKPIPGYEGIYSINEFGDIYSHRINKILKYEISNKGYKTIKLSKNGIVKKFFIHRLVALAFIPNPNNFPIVLHKDNKKLNTHYSNLKWGTYSENNSQAISDGINSIPRPDTRKIYELYNDKLHYRFLGLNQIHELDDYYTISGLANFLYRKRPIACGNLSGFYIRKAEKEKPFIINI